MSERNANAQANDRMELRIGINVGDIIADEGDIFGDEVNVAARLEALAGPGEICVSAAVREQLGEKLPIVFTDMGTQRVKNISRPLRVYKIERSVALDLTRPGNFAERSLTLPDRPSIAVVPFQNMSGDADQQYFCDGVVEDIITGLSRIRWLFVIARNSTFAYQGRPVDVRQVGRELGVRYVLEGSVRRSGDRLRITSQLIEAETGRHVWADRRDQPLGDIFALQDQITLDIIGAIEPSLRHAEIERVQRKRPESLDAYDLTLRALPDVYSVMPARISAALVLLDRALAIEPNYATAHGYAAMCHHSMFLRGGLHEENRSASIRHAQAAISSGQDDSIALSLAGFSMAMDAHDRDAALAAFDAALTISPSSALTYILGATALGWGGDAERAIDWAERGLRLSPLDPWRFIAYRALAKGLFLRGRYAEAADAARKAIHFNPGFGSSYLLLAAPLAKLGRYEEANACVARLLEREPTFRLSTQFAGVDCAPVLAAALREALECTAIPD